MNVRSRKLLIIAVTLALGGLLAAVVALSFGGSGPREAAAAFPGANGKIAFASDRDGNNEVYVMNADGTGQTNLSNNSAYDAEPAWSPDGSQIAFSSSRDGNPEVYVMNADGTGQTNVTNNAAADAGPDWSPDGTKIAFLSARDDNVHAQIYVMNADGSGQTRLTNNPANQDSAPAWSPDGSKIVFTFDPPDTLGDLYVMNPDGSGQTNLTNTAYFDGVADWSPDGTKITYQAFDSGHDIFVMNADGSAQTNLTNSGASDYRPGWSPDGSKIAFNSDRDGNQEIYVMNANGTGPTRLTTNSDTDTSPDWQPQAVARLISASADLIGGAMSRGRLGDVYLANGKVQVVIQQPQRNLLSIGQFGGQIIDADLVRETGDPERDSFEEWAFGVNLENTCHYTSVAVINDGADGNPAVVRATGVDDLLDFINPSSQVAGFGFPFPAGFDDTDLPVTCSTDYSLAAGDTFVQVDTTITNTSGSVVETFFTDLLSASGDVEQFLPGYGFGEPLVSTACARCNFVSWGGVDDAAGVAYGYIHNIPATTIFSTSGVTIPALGVNAALALVGFAAPNYTIAPSGGSETVTRYFAIADDIGSIIDTRNQVLGYTTGTLSGTVTRGGSPVEGAEVTVLGAVVDGPGSAKNAVAYYRTDASGNYSGTLPAGSYTARAHLNGHMPASPDPASVTITASSTTDQDFTIPAAGRLRVTIVDESGTNPIAGKVSVVGFDQYPDPGNSQTILGLIQVNTKLFNSPLGDFRDSMPYGLARALFTDDSGDTGAVFLEPGAYHVVVSHGTEYSIFEQDVTLTAGNLTTVNAQIARVIDSSGFISGDFHIHQIDSPDSETTLEERVISILAEGVDFFTPADHEHRTDIGPVIASMGVDNLVSARVSNENTTPDYGHFIAWPMMLDATKVNGGALDWGSEGVPPVPPPAGQDFPSFGNYMMPPAEIFDNLLADPGVDTVQINHIDTFFDLGGLAVDTAYIPPQDFADNASKRLDPAIANLFDDSFTALESWQGAGRNETLNRFVGRSMGDWFNMLNQGILRSSVADSDTHKRVIDTAGFPRTMVASPTDAPGGLDDIADTLAANVNAGKATGTNGPFIRVTSHADSTSEDGGLGHSDPTLIETTDGNATITVDIQSPLWAEFDTVEFYVNNVPTVDDFDNDPLTPPEYHVAPDFVKTAGTDFTITTVDDFPSIPGAEHLEATVTLGLTGLAQDTWVVVLVRGTDGVSKPIFPIVPNDLDTAANPTLMDLTDGNLGEDGVTTMAFSNPLYIDIGGNGAYDPSGFDSDRDGCTNQEEMGPNEELGGQRSPSNPWDFYDIDGNGLVDLFIDIFGVANAFGDDADSVGPGEPDGYDGALDRAAPLSGGDVWDIGAPDGLIDLFNDIFGVAYQFGHDCTGPP